MPCRAAELAAGREGMSGGLCTVLCSSGLHGAALETQQLRNFSELHYNVQCPSGSSGPLSRLAERSHLASGRLAFGLGHDKHQ